MVLRSKCYFSVLSDIQSMGSGNIFIVGEFLRILTLLAAVHLRQLWRYPQTFYRNHLTRLYETK